ncbi:MAG: hypothetical protein OYH77_03255 [Pseudomonadota bacterium]|nr:hypothetical protein [Pseudomonadota bacterium]
MQQRQLHVCFEISARIRMILWLLAMCMWSGCDYFNDDDIQRIVDAADLYREGDHSKSASEDDNDDRSEKCEEDSNDDNDTPQCDEQAALTAFQTNIQPSIAKSCHMCHAFAAGGLTMKKDDDDATVVADNRINLKASNESVNAERLFLKISNQSTEGHGGGDQSDAEAGNLTLAKIKAWLAAEKDCN